MENKTDIFELLTVEFGTLKALAEKMGVTYNCVYMWKARGRQIPLKNLTKIEQLSDGRITRQMMRPDKFNAVA
jgi:DNA-binding transcriptional regulator YdaS (Cro superfamily)